MKRVRMVTQFESQVDVLDLDALRYEPTWHGIVARLRDDAQKKAEEVGGHVDPDVAPVLMEPQLKQHVLFGGDWLLFAAEWTILVPDDFNIEDEAQRDAPKWRDR